MSCSVRKAAHSLLLPLNGKRLLALVCQLLMVDIGHNWLNLKRHFYVFHTHHNDDVPGGFAIPHPNPYLEILCGTPNIVRMWYGFEFYGRSLEIH